MSDFGNIGCAQQVMKFIVDMYLIFLDTNKHKDVYIYIDAM